MREPTCFFCYRTPTEKGEDARRWDIVWQSYVCPACLERARGAASNGWAMVIPAGAYAEGRPDPNDQQEQGAR